MTKRHSNLFFPIIVTSIFFLAGCSGDDGITDPGDGPDAGSDGDGDSDTDLELDAGQDSGSHDLPPWPSGKYISIDDVYERVKSHDSKMLLLNVSDEEFYEMGHIEGSMKIPWDVLEANLDKVNLQKHIVIYCRRGVRSESAYTTLSQNGLSLLWVMEGGLEEWIAKGYPTVEN